MVKSPNFDFVGRIAGRNDPAVDCDVYLGNFGSGYCDADIASPTGTTCKRCGSPELPCCPGAEEGSSCNGRRENGVCVYKGFEPGELSCVSESNCGTSGYPCCKGVRLSACATFGVQLGPFGT